MSCAPLPRMNAAPLNSIQFLFAILAFSSFFEREDERRVAFINLHFSFNSFFSFTSIVIERKNEERRKQWNSWTIDEVNCEWMELKELVCEWSEGGRKGWVGEFVEMKWKQRQQLARHDEWTQRQGKERSGPPKATSRNEEWMKASWSSQLQANPTFLHSTKNQFFHFCFIQQCWWME